MQNPKILVFGKVGQVGWELRHKLAVLGEVTSVDYPDVDFTKPDSMRDVVRSVAPRVLINAAAYTAVDKAESEPDIAHAINAAAPGVLAEEARKLGSILVHYSTDYVFDGSKRTRWLETDAPSPLNVYGRTKLAGDQAVEAAGGEYLIFRTSWVYGARGKNFLLTMLGKAQSPELRIVDDQFGAPTSSECIAQATAAVLAQVLSPATPGLHGRSGIYNLTNAGETSWYGFARSLFGIAAEQIGTAVPRLVPVSTAEYPLPAQRPVNSRLACDKLAQVFGVVLPPWEHALSLIIETLSGEDRSRKWHSES